MLSRGENIPGINHNNYFLRLYMPSSCLMLKCNSYMFMLIEGCLRGLAVACWTTDHYHPCSNLSMGISEGCFIFDFASLPLEVAQPI